MGTASIVTILFLINIAFSIYISAILLRFLLQLVKADFYNPICQFLIKVTNPLLIPLRRIIPGFFGLDIAAIVLMLLLQTVEIYLIAWINPTQYFTTFLLIKVVIELILLCLNLYFILILVQAVLSWINQNHNNPLIPLLYRLTNPILTPIRKFLPIMGGMDFSPLVAIIIIQAISIFIKAYTAQFGF